MLSLTSSTRGYRCLCPLITQGPERSLALYFQYSCDRSHSFQLDEDADRLVIAFGNTLHIIDPRLAQRFIYGITFNRIQLLQTGTINAVVYNPLNDTFIMSDKQTIFEYRLESGRLQILVDDNEFQIQSVGVDEYSGNVYWADDKHSLNVMSLSSKRKIVLLENLTDICGMLVVPQHG